MMTNDFEKLVPSFLKNSISYYVVITNLDGKYVYVNSCFDQRFSFVTNNFINKDSFVAIYKDDHDLCKEAGMKCLQNPDEVVKIDLRKPDKNNDDFFWTHWEYSAFKNEQNEIIGVMCIGHDVTDREKASRKAIEFEEKVETIIEEITDGFYQLDRNWYFVKFNNVAEKALGVSKEDIIGTNIWEQFPGSEEYKYPTLYRKAMDENVTLTFEEYHSFNDRWYNVVVYPSIEGLSVFFKDITQEKKYIEKIKQQDYYLNAIYNSTTDASTFIDREFKIQYNNKVAQDITYKIFGTSAKVGDLSLDFMLPELKNKFTDYYQRVLRGETIIDEDTDGKQWWQFSLYPVYDDGQIIGIASNVKDITERKDKDLKLLESEHKLQKSIEAIPNPMLIVNEDITIQYANEEFEKVFGYHETEVIGKTIDFLIPERFRLGHEALYKSYLAEGGKSMRMGRFIGALTKSGDELVVEANLNTFTSGGERYIIVILQDITELKKQQDTILQKNEVLRSIAWEQSHKLRTPLTNILSLCDLLKNSSHEPEETKLLYVDYLYKAAHNLDEVVRKIVANADRNKPII